MPDFWTINSITSCRYEIDQRFDSWPTSRQPILGTQWSTNSCPPSPLLCSGIRENSNERGESFIESSQVVFISYLSLNHYVSVNIKPHLSSVFQISIRTLLAGTFVRWSRVTIWLRFVGYIASWKKFQPMMIWPWSKVKHRSKNKSKPRICCLASQRNRNPRPKQFAALCSSWIVFLRARQNSHRPTGQLKNNHLFLANIKCREETN